MVGMKPPLSERGPRVKARLVRLFWSEGLVKYGLQVLSEDRLPPLEENMLATVPPEVPAPIIGAAS